MPISPQAPSGTQPYSFHYGDAMDAYSSWDAPDLIISDGAYGVMGFPGDPAGTDGLVEWYEPHVMAWSEAAKPSTSLWFWNTEAGWATVHPLLLGLGWEYIQLVIWDKGMAHVAGNVNGKTIRQLPVVTEVSALYRRRLLIKSPSGEDMPAQEWLRSEWKRAGLTQQQANEACGTKSAASRKYLTADRQWYMPPGDMIERMAMYANAFGREDGRPYLCIDGQAPVDATTWDGMRATWNHENGLTNVWLRPPLSGRERIRISGGSGSAHLNQKPQDLMERQIRLASNKGDVVWEPFGGLASASVAAVRMGRRAFVAECNEGYAAIAATRLLEAVTSHQ